jgi:hypothetical protein
VVNDLSREELRTNCKLIACADDLALTIPAKTRRNMDEMPRVRISMMEKRSHRNELTLFHGEERVHGDGGKMARLLIFIANNLPDVSSSSTWA